MSRKSTVDPADDLTPEERAELGDVGPILEQMSRYVVPVPQAAETRKLLAHLRPLVAARAAAQVDRLPDDPPAPSGLRHWVQLAWSQTTLLEPAFWWACVAVYATGVLLALVDPMQSGGILFALSSPVLAAAGVAYAFRPTAQSTWELEKTCPIQPLELLYARLGLVLGFNLLFTLGLLGVLFLHQPGAFLWRLALVWFGPMLGLAGVALYTTIRWGVIVGSALPLGLWAALLSLSWQWAGEVAGNLAPGVPMRVLTTLVGSNGVLMGSVGALAVGLLLLHRAGHLSLGEAEPWN